MAENQNDFNQKNCLQDVVVKKELPDCSTEIKSEPFDIENSEDNRCENIDGNFYFSQIKTKPLENDTEDNYSNGILQNFVTVKKEEMPFVKNERQDSMEVESTATIENEKSNLKCYKCGAEFTGDTKAILLRRHLRIHVDKKPFSCHDCPMIINTEAKIIDHLFAHSEKPYKCNKCHKRFFTDLHLNDHVKNHKIYECKECGINFYLKSEISEHNKKLKHNVCSLCEKVFTTKLKLTRHVKLSHLAKARPFKYNPDDKLLTKCFKNDPSGSKSPFKCGKCQKQFKTCKSLGDHLRANGKKEIFQCKECQVEFFARCAFNRHFKIYNHNKCSDCGKIFDDKKALMIHLEDYVLEEPTVCDVCQSEIMYGCHFQRH